MPPETDAASEKAAREPKVRRISSKPPRKAAESEAATTLESKAETLSKTDQKRSRRRRGKGKSGQKESDASIAKESPVAKETIALAPETPQPRLAQKEQPDARDKPQENRPQQPQKPRRKPDPGKVAKNAWKIFLAEVSEEGVALIADNDARELARRCFRLSEIFLEEEEKRG